MAIAMLAKADLVVPGFSAVPAFHWPRICPPAPTALADDPQKVWL